MSKEHMRKRLASLSFSEKIEILEKLRDRSLAICSQRTQTEKANHAGNRQQVDSYRI